MNMGNSLPFFNEYASAYGGIKSGYGYTRPNSIVMLGYDAMLVLLEASKMALAGKNQAFTPGQQSITPEELENALRQIHGSQAVQGITGVISFGTDGNPINKENFVLRVDNKNLLHIDLTQGCFLKAQCIS